MDFDAIQRTSVSPAEAKRLMSGRKKVGPLEVQGSLTFSAKKGKVNLPDGLSVWSLNMNDARGLTRLPAGLRCNVLELRNTGIESISEDVQVQYRLDLQDCTALKSLPAGLKVGSLNLSGCTNLASLPEGLECSFLNINGCTKLHEFPRKGKIHIGNLLARNCLGLPGLPIWLTQVAGLDISGCTNIRSLPPRLRVSSWIDIGKSGVRKLPAGLENVQIRWRGVAVTRRIALQPETISAAEVVQEENVELRRAMLESMGTERFLSEANAELLDTDTDAAGGERKLLRVSLKNDEDLVCVAVRCPSTDRQYLLRVPPKTKTCRQAVAWTAGFDRPDKYRPLIET